MCIRDRHTTGGYMVYASMTHQYIFNYKPKDIYWCTADIGWITGHSYIIYGPLANCATTIMFEGIPTYPDTSRWWQIIDKYKVNIFYTAPTVLKYHCHASGFIGSPTVPSNFKEFLEVFLTGPSPSLIKALIAVGAV